MSKRNLSVFWIVFFWWAACSLVLSGQTVRMNQALGTPVSWAESLVSTYAGWMTWVPLTLGLYWLIRRYPIERGRVLRSGLVMAAAVAVIVFLRAVYVYSTDSIFDWYGDKPLPDFGGVLLASVDSNFLMSWIVVGMVHALVFYERIREREKKVAELETSLATTRLDVLRAQLNPHFLFNALNSVAEMVHRDAEQADRMLVSLSSLLRDSLALDRGQQRPLREELALVRHYLMIEAIRLGDRLRVEWQVAADCLEVPVPALILQPLVENAIIHGIARRRTAGTLRLSARIVGRQLLLEVENSAAPQTDVVPGTGIGLQSTRSRLQLLYGAEAGLSQAVSDSGRYLMRLNIPAARMDPVAKPSLREAFS